MFLRVWRPVQMGIFQENFHYSRNGVVFPGNVWYNQGNYLKIQEEFGVADKKTFRTALNGFNREDVVRYIEYLNAQHTAEVEELTAEVAQLRSALEKSPEAAAETDDSRQIKTLEERLQAAQEEKEGLEAQIQAALAAKYQAETALETLRQESARNVTGEELEAYRRAERTERLARERSEKVYHQVNGVLADASVKVDEAAQTIGDLSDRVLEQLNRLEEAVYGSKEALQQASQTMYALRPTQEEE